MKLFTLLLAISISMALSAQTKKKTTTKKKVTNTKTATLIKTPLTGVAALSENEIVNGLKDALSQGSIQAASQLSVLDGFNRNTRLRIPFPAEAQVVADKLREYGFGAKVDEFETTLNRAAEKAAQEAAPIFVNAIRQMTITDAKNILQGPNNAATSYLQSKTNDALTATFSPVIKNALGSTLATSKWTELTTLYNRIPFVTAVDTDLTRYTTTRALSALFTVVADEELKIRQNPAARGTELLQKVFGSLGK